MFQFGLVDLMIVIAAIATDLGMFQLSIAHGIVGSVILLLAVFRTLGSLRRAREWGIPLSPVELVLLIVSSLGISTLIVLSAGLAFFATSLPIGFIASVTGPVGVGVAIVRGLFAATWITRTLYRAIWNTGSLPYVPDLKFLDELRSKDSSNDA